MLTRQKKNKNSTRQDLRNKKYIGYLEPEFISFFNQLDDKFDLIEEKTVELKNGDL